MKAKVFFIALLASTMLGLSACGDDDNYTPEDGVVNAFKSKYPEAQRVEWETKAGYKVADFYINSKEAEAWFDDKGNWVMTETDITYNELPQAVQTGFKASIYADYRIDDVDKLERSNTATVYVIEVEGTNDQDYDLYFSEDGRLLKEINEGGNNGHQPSVISEAVTNEIKRLYPNARILEFDRENSFLEVDILDGNIHKEVLFNNNNEWVSTEWDIRFSEVPAIVTGALQASEYKDWKVDDIDVFEKPDELFYVFELESGNNEIHLTIKSDGTIVSK